MTEKKIDKSFGLHEYKCAVCGKKFEGHAEYAYKKRMRGLKSKTFKYYCSYSCMRKDD